MSYIYMWLYVEFSQNFMWRNKNNNRESLRSTIIWEYPERKIKIIIKSAAPHQLSLVSFYHYAETSAQGHFSNFSSGKSGS